MLANQAAHTEYAERKHKLAKLNASVIFLLHSNDDDVSDKKYRETRTIFFFFHFKKTQQGLINSSFDTTMNISIVHFYMLNREIFPVTLFKSNSDPLRITVK